MRYEVRDELFTLLGHLEFGEIMQGTSQLRLAAHRSEGAFAQFYLDVKPAVDHERNKYIILSMQNTPENLDILNGFDAFTPVPG